MSLKNYLDNWVNKDYFKLLLKRHMSLGLVPLAVFVCLLFLYAVLNAEMEALIVFLIPYALAIVPLSALILFKTYTKKGDLAYLASIPLTRKQLFTTTYLVGLTIIESTLLIMTTITFIEYASDLLLANITFLSLGIIYYTLACLGCMLGGKTTTQFINMGIICFGPVLLYLISKLCISEIAFGHFSTSYNDSLLMIICPLISAAEFMTGDTWTYWWAHILLVVGVFWLSIYLVGHRHFETDSSERLSNWILKPVIYLNITYTLFIICFLATLGQHYYYDWSFYIKTFALLVGVSVLVACLMAIWTSKSISMIFKKENIVYQVCLIIFSCMMMIVPLWQTENQRYKYIEDRAIITFISPNGHWYDITVSKQEAKDILNVIDEQRSLMINGKTYDNIEKEVQIILESQRYMFNLDEVNQPLIDLCEFILVRARDNDDLWYEYGTPMQEYEIYKDGSGVYQASQLIEAYKNTYENELTKAFLEKLIIDWRVDSSYNIFYPVTFSSMPYEQWEQEVYAHVELLFDEAKWNEVRDCVIKAIENTNNIHVTSKYVTDIVKRSGSIKLDGDDAWQIIEANQDYVKLHVGVWVYLIEDYENGDMMLFKDSDVSLSFEVELVKDREQWIPTITGVYYR